MTYDPQDPLGTVFADIIGLPVWQVKRGHGSFLTMEFGAPSLVVREPRASDAKSRRVRDLLARRRVFIRGKWHLWIYCCDWKLAFNARLAAHSESSDARVDEALTRLDGQKLISVEPGPKGRSTFQFDLGATLTTRPLAAEAADDAVESWMLFAPRGRVLSLWADGSLTWKSASAKAG